MQRRITLWVHGINFQHEFKLKIEEEKKIFQLENILERREVILRKKRYFQNETFWGESFKMNFNLISTWIPLTPCWTNSRTIKTLTVRFKIALCSGVSPLILSCAFKSVFRATNASKSFSTWEFSTWNFKYLFKNTWWWTSWTESVEGSASSIVDDIRINFRIC